jgi:hypothetical protein
MTQHYRIRIRKNEIEIDIKYTDIQFVQAKLAELKEEFLAKRTADSGYSSPETLGFGKKESLLEFLKRVSPKAAIEYAVGIAYYLEKVEGIEEITVKHIKERFRRVKFQHSNPSQVLVDAKIKSLLMDGSAPKQYTLTQSGEKWVEDRLQAKT